MAALLTHPNGLFTFDPVEHLYRLDGQIIPGVSDILEETGLKHGYNGFQEAQYRGLHVHRACEYLDLNDLDWNSIHPAYVGYVKAWQAWKAEYGFVPELIEYQAYHSQFRYGGTLDRRGVVRTMLADGSHKAVSWRVLVDLKTGAPEPWHRWQLAGYQLLGGEAWLTDRRLAVYLHDDGTFTMQEFSDPTDLRVFLAAVTITHAKRSLR